MSYGRRVEWLSRQQKQTSNQSKKIVLFDMDGTLTEPRESFDNNLLLPLRSLSKKAQIGIVSGSDIDYIYQQMGYVLNQTELRYKIHLLPCNGTKYYKPPSTSNGKHELVFNNDIKSELGNLNFKKLMIILLNYQANLEHHSLPFSLTGHFISYRGSMINWSPIGRNANTEERKIFIDYDKSKNPNYRSIILNSLKEKLALAGLLDKVEIKLGGDTSFDIYPIGWDKTYAINHFPDWDIWFVGDRCGSDGNDKELYDLLIKDNKSFETKDTKNTKLIIQESILPHL